MKGILLLLVRFYRAAVSPLLGPGKCRFEPTCSAYAQEALRLHGAFRGSWLTLWRILRCQPLCKGGFDPVPLPASATTEPRPEESPCSHRSS